MSLKLSIILVNHNARQRTLDCIASIYDKTSAPNEIVLVDNASADGTALAVKQKYPAVKVIENGRNAGFARANNQGIEIARGEYVLLLNNDTVLRNEAIDRLMRFMENNPKAGILSLKILDKNGSLQRNCRSFYNNPLETMFARSSFLSQMLPGNPMTRRATLSDWDYNSARQVDWVSGACMMVRRAVLDQIGHLDQNYFMYWEDTDICKRARDAGWQVWFTPEAEIIHYTGAGGTKLSNPFHNIRMIYHKHRSAYYYFRKHYYKNPLHPLAILSFAGMTVLVLIKGANEILHHLIKR